MQKYTMTVNDGCLTQDDIIEAEDLDAAIEIAEQHCRDGVAYVVADVGDDVENGEEVVWKYEISEIEDEDEILASGNVSEMVHPDLESLRIAAGAPEDCDHEFRAHGGMRENPGVYGLPGNGIQTKIRCRHCGLVEIRSWGDMDRADYEIVHHMEPVA